MKEDSPTDNASPKSAIEMAQKTIKSIAHSRTKSDITPTATGTGSSGKSGGKTFSLSRSKSIASARDKWKISSSYGLLPFLSKDNSKNSLSENDDQLRKENDSLRLKLNTECQERQRLEREMDRYANHYDQCQEELHELRDQQKQLLATEGGPSESLSIIYSNLLRKYEAGKDEYQKLLVSHQDLVTKSEQYQDQLKQYKNSYENVLNERNQFKQQCTQAFRQLDQVLEEKSKLSNELKLAMDIRVKARKDIQRLTDQRNNALHEYSVIMSEREAVHSEMEKLQEELQNKAVMSKEIELLQREIRAALADRDKAMKELHEIKRKFEDKENLNPTFNSQELKSLQRAMEEIKVLKKEKQELEKKLETASMEADVAKGRRDWAFTERDKVMLESEGVQALCDKLRKERDKAVNDLIDKIKEMNDIKVQNKIDKENAENEQKESKVSKREFSGKILHVDQKLDASKFHGIILDEGVYVRALTANSIFARNNSVQVGDKILQINNINVSDDIDQARSALNKNESLSLTIERDVKFQPTTKVKSSQSFVARRDTDEKRNDFVSKMIQKSDHEPKPIQAVSKLFTSSERVYSISNTPSHGKKTWTHFKENVKEKLDLVKGRRQSTEQGEDDEKVDYCPAITEKGEKIKQGEIKDVETLFRQHQNTGRKTESGTESAEDECQKYSLDNLDDKILEMKQNFAAPQTPVNTKSRLWTQGLSNPQDVVQSHFSQVQSRIQDMEKLTISSHNKPLSSDQQQKEDYFLASSASETSLNDSLKSGNLDEHEVVYQDPERHSTSIPEDDQVDFEKSKVQYSKYKDVFQFTPRATSCFQQYNPPQSIPGNFVTSPKRTSPFPAVKSGLQPNSVYQDPHHLYSSLYPSNPNIKSPGGPSSYSPAFDSYRPPSYQADQGHNIYAGYSRNIPAQQEFFSLPPDVPFSKFPSYPSNIGAACQNRLSLASAGASTRASVASVGHSLSPTESREKPCPGDIRQKHIEMSGEKLGITIAEVNIDGEMAGIFISRVSMNSLAARYGLHVGDQLLEVGGINLRTAKKSMAATVLQGAGKSVDIKVQYNPDKFEMGCSNSAESLYGYTGQHVNTVSPILGYSKMEMSPPSLPLHKSTPIRSESQSHMFNNDLAFGDDAKSKSSTLKSALNLDLVPAAHSTVIADECDQENNYQPQTGAETPKYSSISRYEARLLKPVLRKSGVLGVKMVGGNAVGIFVHSIESGSAASEVGLQRGDQILEYNGIDLRHATAEQAAYELAQPVVMEVTILVRFNPDKYREIKDSPGDSYFIRALFDRTEYDKDASDLQLLFSKDDILWVDNTIYNGVPGNWSAWILDRDGNKVKWGLIPSKYKVGKYFLCHSPQLSISMVQ